MLDVICGVLLVIFAAYGFLRMMQDFGLMRGGLPPFRRRRRRRRR